MPADSLDITGHACALGYALRLDGEVLITGCLTDVARARAIYREEVRRADERLAAIFKGRPQ